MDNIVQLLHDKRKNPIWQYYAFNFLKDFGFFSAVLVPFFTKWGHISLTQVQLLQSWFMLCLFFFDLPTSIIADHIGRKYALALGTLIEGIGALLYGSIPNMFVFIIGEFLMAVGISSISGADDALLYDILKEGHIEHESKKIYGRAHAFNFVGILIATIAGSFIAAKLGLNTPMQLSMIPLLIASVVAVFMKSPVSVSKPKARKNYFTIAKKGLIFFYEHKILRTLALDGLIVDSAAYFVIWFYQPLLERIHISIFYFGFFQAILLLTEIGISGNFTWFEKFFGSGKVFLRFSALSTAGAFLIAALFPNLFTAVLLIIFAGGFGLTRIELLTAYMNKFIPSGQRATVLSSISTFRRIALVLLNPLIGFTADHSLQGAFFLVGLLPLALFFFSPIEQEMLE